MGKIKGRTPEKRGCDTQIANVNERIRKERDVKRKQPKPFSERAMT